MNKEERRLRDAWLAEMWETVPEYDDGLPSKEAPRPVKKTGEKRRRRVA